MGVVYRALDRRLSRQVAVKILPEQFAGDPERRLRFEREARTLAALNHQHIAQIYGFEQSGETHFLVMELVEGETLAQRISHGPIPLQEALSIARQIAEALEAAHEQGIIHRDLKPSNILLKDSATGTAGEHSSVALHSGEITVKLLDFGLAKLQGPAAREQPVSGLEDDISNSPTVAGQMTGLGIVLGTAAYMAPEQARGRAVDRRADIWSFGVVFYEMLTGRPLWQGETVTDLIAAVVTREADWSRLPAGTPPPALRLLRRCLEKDPRRRLRHVGDAVLEIDEALTGAWDDTPIVAPNPAPRRMAVLCGLAVLFVLLGVLLGGWWFGRVPDSPRLVTRFTRPLAPGFSDPSRPLLAISPDGSRFAYQTQAGVYVQDLDAFEPRLLLAMPLSSELFFSPGGDWIGFYDQKTGFMRMPVTGGTVQNLSGPVASFPHGITWNGDGSILFAIDNRVWRIPSAGAVPELLFNSQEPSVPGQPQVLPGGRHILYTETTPRAGSASETVVRALDGSDRQVVLKNAPAARYVETGHLVYGFRARLRAVAFDAGALRVTGPEVFLPQQPRASPLSGIWQGALSRTGTLIFLPASQTQDGSDLVWADRSGEVTRLPQPKRHFSDPRLSPDGRSLALHLLDEENDIWVRDLERGALTRLTFHPGEDETPVWSPDGRYLAYAGTRGQHMGIYRRAADGSSPEELLWVSPGHAHVMDWASEDRLILNVFHPERGNDLILLSLSSGRPEPLLQTPFNEVFGRLSPDGKWLAYGLDESGLAEIYVQSFPALDARIQISTEGGFEPIWSRDGRELFYRSSSHIMAVTVSSGTPVAFSAPRALFADRFLRPQGRTHIAFDVARDGRFLLVEAGDSDLPDEVHVILNWFEELKRLVPGGSR